MHQAAKTTLERLVGLAGDSPHAMLGLYVHGSQARGDARADSDLDVLVLHSATLPNDQRDSIRNRLLEVEPNYQPGLDLKVISAATFADDPWVDLRTAIWAGGHPWHEELPPRTHDQGSRESLLVLAVLIEDQAFAETSADRLHKPVGRLCSVLAAQLGEQVPESAKEAVSILTAYPNNPTAVELAAITTDLNTRSAALPPGLGTRIQRALDTVIEMLSSNLQQGRLGPRCSIAALNVLAAIDGTREDD